MFEIICAQSCPKMGETIKEDYFRAESNLLAVADGAGGAGIFSGEWADYLLKNLPKHPLLDRQGLNDWLDGIWAPFFEEIEQKELDSDIRNKFLEEGSFSTLSAIWIENHKLLHWVSYGDCVLLLVDMNTGITARSISDLRVFSKAPDLLNWQSESLQGDVLQQTHPAEVGLFVLLCTDALGQYLLLTDALAQEKSDHLEEIRQMPFRLANLLERLEQAGVAQDSWIEKILNPLVESAKNAERFKEYMYDLENRGFIAPDDYTFVFAKVV